MTRRVENSHWIFSNGVSVLLSSLYNFHLSHFHFNSVFIRCFSLVPRKIYKREISHVLLGFLIGTYGEKHLFSHLFRSRFLWYLWPTVKCPALVRKEDRRIQRWAFESVRNNGGTLSAEDGFGRLALKRSNAAERDKQTRKGLQLKRDRRKRHLEKALRMQNGRMLSSWGARELASVLPFCAFDGLFKWN